MQWPPTSPGWNVQEIPFGAPRRSTSPVSMPSRWKIADNSFMKRDVEVALRVLDDLGGFGHLDRRRAWMPAVTTEP